MNVAVDGPKPATEVREDSFGVGLFVAQNTVLFLSRLSPELRFSIPWDQLRPCSPLLDIASARHQHGPAHLFAS